MIHVRSKSSSSRPKAQRSAAGAERPLYWLLLFVLLTSAAHAQTVLKLTLHDTIQPVSAGYIQRGLAQAAADHDAAVILSLGTPGGLLESTRVIVSAIDQSPVPVIVYIAPSGSRAGSAGFFILESADIAAMAPGTNAGAAHPILEGTTMDPVLKQKIENDAIAFFRSYAGRRGRDLQAATDAILQSKSYTDSEALQLHLIDLTAPDDAALLHSLNGRTITRFDGAHATLRLDNPRIDVLRPTVRERLLSRLVDPNFAVLLLIIGGLLIYLEFNVPGTIVPGSLGTLFVLLALFGLNLLPLSGIAILLLIAAATLILLEAKFPSHGVLASGGVVSLIFGLLLLVNGPIPEMRVHPPIALSLGVAFGGISFFLAFIAARARRNKVLTGPQAMVGGIALVRKDLAPVGQVEIRGELWQARIQAPHTSAAVGHHVRVCAVDGLTLLVEPIAPPAGGPIALTTH